MNGVHDMGGMHGFGPVVREENEPVFHEPWEGRMYAMSRDLNLRRPPGPGVSRDFIERIEPARYLSLSYSERLLHSLEQRAIRAGVVTALEIEQRMQLIEKEGGDPLAPRFDPDAAQQIVTRLKTNQARPASQGSPPHFAKGDAVVARNLNWTGHNRLPRYVRGKRGVIERVNGLYRIEDAHADALGPDPQTVYTVRFAGAEVWGPECEAGLTVYLELWEGYLEPVSVR